MFDRKSDPDFNRLLTALTRSGVPDRVPLYELLIDVEVVSELTGTSFNWGTEEGRDPEKDIQTLMDLYLQLGFDYFPGFASLEFPRDNFVLTSDTADLSRGQRQWFDEHTGAISNWEDFERYH